MERFQSWAANRNAFHERDAQRAKLLKGLRRIPRLAIQICNRIASIADQDSVD